MSILNRYVLRQVVVPSLLAVSVVAVLGVANEIQERLTDLPVAQMTLGDISRLILYFLPTLVAYIVPATYLMGILLAFGRLSQNGEIVAMKAAGIPMKRIVLPVVLLGALLSGASFLVQDRVQPWAISKVYDLIFSELPLRATLDTMQPGVMHEFGDWRVYIGAKEPRSTTLKDIVILQPEGDGDQATTHYADAARLVQEDGRTLLEMENYHFIPAGETGKVFRLDSPSARIPVPEITDSFRPEAGRRALTMRQLYASQRQMAHTLAQTKSEPVIRDLRKERGEIAERLSLPFACLAVSLAAAPLGARAKRSGRSYTFAVGFAIILTYYVLQMLLAPKSLCSLPVVILRYWVPNFVLGAAGIVFLWRVDRV